MDLGGMVGLMGEVGRSGLLEGPSISQFLVLFVKGKGSALYQFIGDRICI